jgi:hypothetical protein
MAAPREKADSSAGGLGIYGRKVRKCTEKITASGRRGFTPAHQRHKLETLRPEGPCLIGAGWGPGSDRCRIVFFPGNRRRQGISEHLAFHRLLRKKIVFILTLGRQRNIEKISLLAHAV